MAKIINSPPQTAVDTQDADGNLLPPSEGWRAFMNAVWTICNSLTESGTTAQRPTALLWIGRRYWDIDLQMPVYYSGAGVWKTAAGVPA